MLNYRAIEIFTDEDARHRGRPLSDTVIEYVRSLKLAARCMVTRGIAGCSESGAVATERQEILSCNLPIRITILLPKALTEKVLTDLDGMVEQGIIVLRELHVVGYKTANTFFPPQLAVRDVMTAGPVWITANSPLDDAARLLLSAIFTGLPVVDAAGRPIGVVTQGDLITRGGMPLRLGLLAESEDAGLAMVMAALARQRVAAVMTSPAVTIAADRPLLEAVDLMVSKDLKRLPVVGQDGCLVGMLSRLDIFKTVMREAPDWQAFTAQKIKVHNLRTVSDIARRDTHTVLPETTIDQVIKIINENDIQRVAVVDSEGKLLGLIDDRDLLRYFKPNHAGVSYLFARISRSFSKAGSYDEIEQRLAQTKAEEVMRTDVGPVRETMLIEEAIRVMTEKTLKRLPVVDEHGHFTGMISRDSLLRTGFGQAR